MTPYEQGFLSKCQSFGIPEQLANGLLKLAFDPGLQQAEQEYREQYGEEPPDDWYIERAMDNGRSGTRALSNLDSQIRPVTTKTVVSAQNAVNDANAIIQENQPATNAIRNGALGKPNNIKTTIPQPSMCPSCGQPISKAAYDSLLKAAESSDPNLQRASEIFKDWLTTKKHTVRSGEVLSGIARKYNVSLEDIQKENNLSSVLAIKPGQQIKIPIVQNGKKM